MNDTSYPDLFWIIGYIRSQAIDSLSIMPIRALDNFQFEHSRLEWQKNSGQTHMVHLLDKMLIFNTFSLLLIGYIMSALGPIDVI